MLTRISVKGLWGLSGNPEVQFRNSVRPIQRRHRQFWQNWNSKIRKIILQRKKVRRSRSLSTFTCHRSICENRFRNFRIIGSLSVVPTLKFRHPAMFDRRWERWRTEFLFSSRSSVCPTFHFSAFRKSVCRPNQQLMTVDHTKILKMCCWINCCDKLIFYFHHYILF